MVVSLTCTACSVVITKRNVDPNARKNWFTKKGETEKSTFIATKLSGMNLRTR